MPHPRPAGRVGSAEITDRGDGIGELGVDDVVRSQLGGERELLLADVHGDDLRPDKSRVLHREMPEAAEA